MNTRNSGVSGKVSFMWRGHRATIIYIAAITTANFLLLLTGKL